MKSVIYLDQMDCVVLAGMLAVVTSMTALFVVSGSWGWAVFGLAYGYGIARWYPFAVAPPFVPKDQILFTTVPPQHRLGRHELPARDPITGRFLKRRPF